MSRNINKLLYIELGCNGKDKWGGKRYRTTRSGYPNSYLSVVNDNEPFEFRWILFINPHDGSYCLSVRHQDGCGETDSSKGYHCFEDGIEALDMLICLIKKEKYGFEVG